MSDFFTSSGFTVPGLISIAYFITILFVVILVILQNRTPIKTIGWVLVLMLLPGIGIIFYLFFGQEYRKKKMFSRKGLGELEKLRQITSEQLQILPYNYNVFSEAVYSKRHLINLLLTNSHAFVSSNNEVRILKNGEQAFPAMFQAIEDARCHIHIEFYIIEDDTIGKQFKELLIKKAREGVEVRLIYDDVGSWKLPKKYIKELKEAGVKIDCFIKVRFPLLTSKVNYRNHRKIVVVDGNIGFIGGLNIADRYLVGSRFYGIWRDTHLMVKGGAASGLQVIFMADWYFVSKEIFKGSPYYISAIEGSGKIVQITSSGPDSDWKSISQAYFSAIASAQKQVLVATPYFIPNEEINSAMKTAALGGIDVKILLPQKSDATITKWSTFSYIAELLEAGVKVYFYQAGFTHSKLLIVDGVFSSVGTANFDFRSLETNFEVNAMIYDEEVASELIFQFQNDLKHSRQVVLTEWEQRSRWSKAKESFARILSPLL